MEKEAMGLCVNIAGTTQAADNSSTLALVSIAISMKRIADLIEIDKSFRSGTITLEEAVRMMNRG